MGLGRGEWEGDRKERERQGGDREGGRGRESVGSEVGQKVGW